MQLLCRPVVTSLWDSSSGDSSSGDSGLGLSRRVVSGLLLTSLLLSGLAVSRVVAQERDSGAHAVARVNVGSSQTVSSPPNHCSDSGVDGAWRDKLTRYPNDPVVQRLYALRSGLCLMVETGQIDLANAARLFELEQGRAVVERLQDENQANPYRAL